MSFCVINPRQLEFDESVTSDGALELLLLETELVVIQKALALAFVSDTVAEALFRKRGS